MGWIASIDVRRNRVCGRVGASLLNAVGVPELVADSLDEYEALAKKLATAPALLGFIRRRLQDNRLTGALFDTERFRRHIEAAYVTMWETWRRGEKPESFSVGSIDMSIERDHGEAPSNHCNASKALDGHQEVSASRDKVLAKINDSADDLNRRGMAQLALKQYNEAAASFEKALTINPGYVEALCNLGVVLGKLRRHRDEILSCDRALSINPNHLETLNNRGAALCDSNRYQEALASYDKSLTINPNHVEALINRGLSLRALNRAEEAMASCDKALTIKPDNAEAHFNKGLICLLIGDFITGWPEYEWRWEREEKVSQKRNFGRPLWVGKEPLAGRTILLHAEQGFGDTIMAARYVSRVGGMGARVILEIPTPLEPLFRQIKGVSEIAVNGQPLPGFDVHCPLMSLPLAFGTTLGTIPAEIPYLTASQDRVAEWKSRLGDARVPRIGIVWSGSQQHKNNRNRSIPLEGLDALRSPDLQLVSLQKDTRKGDEELLRRYDIRYFGEEIRDFADTAALISLMDIVISVDTSVAHLAGAMGKPVWILLPFSPDWRWLLDREDSPWYPTARLLRQPAIGDWSSVIARVREELGSGQHRQRERESAPPSFSIGSIGAEAISAVPAESRAPKPTNVKTANLDLQQALQRAVGLNQQGQLAEAEHWCQQILKVKFDHFDALHLLGGIKVQQRKFEEALSPITAAAQAKPDSAEAAVNLGIVLAKLGRYEEALSSFDKALVLKPDYAEALFARGHALKALGRYDEALSSHDMALAITPDHVEALINRGNVLRVLSRLDDALASYDKALAIKPDHVDALNNRGTALYILNRHEEAIASYDKALEIKSDHVEALNRAGSAFLHRALSRISA
jgi:tetratricopeptide (TPR) repeat protein